MSGVPAASQPPPQPVRWVRVISVAVRLAVIVLIMAAAGWLINAYRGVVPTRAAGPKTQPPESAETPGDWLLSPGGWSLGDAPWQMARAEVAAADLPARMSSTGPPLANRPPSAVETDVVAWLARSTTATRKNGVAEYTLTVNQTKFRGVTEATPGGERLRLGQVAWPDGGGWHLLELVPAGGDVGAAEPLLPLPAGAALVARRWSESRHVVADLVGPVSPDADPAAGWQHGGWSRAAQPAGVPGERFTRGGAVREVWRLPGAPGGAGQDYLLVFIPPTR